MAILEKEVWVGLSYMNIKHYENLGYKIPRHRNKSGKPILKTGTKILVNIKDLTSGSNVKVTKICDNCKGILLNQTYCTIVNNRVNSGKDYCYKCRGIKSGSTKRNNVKYEKSLEGFAKDNNMTYLINEFSNKNSKTVNEVSFGTQDKYLWNCSKCNSEYAMSINNRTSKLKKRNCPYCTGRRVNHTNNLVSTHPEICELLTDKKISLSVTSGSNKKTNFTCGRCGYISAKQICNVVLQGFSCPRCSDGISYAEKFMMSILHQLKINFDKEKVFEWSKNIDLPNKKLNGMKKYDFYLPDLNCIIETHGTQHYNKSFETIGGRSLKEEQENDRMKEELARRNGIDNYIVIDCKKSEMDYIKSNILKSKLNNIFDISEVDFMECHESACKSLVKEACDLWNSGIKNIKEISKTFNAHTTTIGRYLKNGARLGWCDYNPKKIMEKNGKLNGGSNKKKIVQLTLDERLVNKWESILQASESLGKKSSSNIHLACSGKAKTAYGYKWMYEEDYEEYIKQANIS